MIAAHQPADRTVRCDCCRYPAGGRLVEYRGETPAESGVFCALCRGTLAGTWHTSRLAGDVSGLDAAALEVMRAICHVGNTLLDAIREGHKEG